VLVVDDDVKLTELLRDYLEQNGAAVTSAPDGTKGLEALDASGPFDVVLLDVMMPGIDGIEVCKRIRQKSNVPIVITMIMPNGPAAVVGLELGALVSGALGQAPPRPPSLFSDAHAAALNVLEDGRFKAFNLGNGNGFSVRQVIDRVSAVTGREVAWRAAPRRPGDPPSLVADAAVAHRELGWTPRYPDLREIMASAWAWHVAHPHGYA